MNSNLGRGRRQGLNKKDFRASGYRPLHANARDSRAVESSPPKASAPVEEEDIFAPPKESDESETGHDSDDFIRKVKTISAPLREGSHEDSIERSSIFRSSRKQTYTSKTTQKKMKGKPKQNARPPRRKNPLPPNKGTEKENSKSEDVFQAIPPPRKSTGTNDNDGFMHIPRRSSSKSSDDSFVVPPEIPNRRSTGKDSQFVHPKQATNASSKSRITKSWSTVNDINEYFSNDDKKRTRDESEDPSSESSTPKRRKTSPEPEFLVPPVASARLDDGIPYKPWSGIKAGNGYDDGSDSPLSDVGSLSSSNSFKEIRSSNTSVSGSQSTKCLVCLAVIDSSLLEKFRVLKRVHPKNRLTVRQQELLHIYHSKRDLRIVWKERNYPEIDWEKFTDRLTTHHAHISAIIEGASPSYHRSKLRERRPGRGRRTITLAEEMKTGEDGSKVLGYYGARGQRVAGDWLLSQFSKRLKQKYKDPDIKLAGGVSNFVQKVLISELIQQLLIEDMQTTPVLRDGAQARAETILAQNKQDNQQTLQDDDLYTSVHAAATEAEISKSISELKDDDASEKQISWLARFVAMESAQCGMLFSEEIEDVIPAAQSGSNSDSDSDSDSESESD